jgi:predicted flap endonuclease-1-like 5' DNA nuclease
MASSKPKEPLSDIPAGIGKPALRALAAAGYTHLEQLARVKEDELLKLHGVGPKAIRVLRAALEIQGLSFGESTHASR